MPRIFDNIDLSLLPALRETLACFSHHLPVEARDRPVITSLRLPAVLTVLSKYAKPYLQADGVGDCSIDPESFSVPGVAVLRQGASVKQNFHAAFRRAAELKDRIDSAEIRRDP